MSEDLADVTMRNAPGWGYVGRVGGEGIPIIDFSWKVENPKRITGDLKSEIQTNGMTCRISPPYELDSNEWKQMSAGAVR